ncbi:uncharacterized protein LOC130646135 [Hydractinia symbiolongicarpus]|uniref:uncharacterized protein LOC130644155 n=1 Tax=Hydractinia symbiolongicarpus TaxID=13093 RepID=UPI00254B062E|nr:uncharacterized protein LOC130644155 [Hydractinia symbiolongicarpus]XP_057308260.1 uncharacterized protein LOC130646135 [Hydractinia symbiolongicarpus]
MWSLQNLQSPGMFRPQIQACMPGFFQFSLDFIPVLDHVRLLISLCHVTPLRRVPQKQGFFLSSQIFWEGNKVTNIFNKHAPVIDKRVKGRLCPWMTTDIRVLMTDRDKALRYARKTNKACDWTAYKKLRNKCTYAVNMAKFNSNKKLLEENSDKPRKFWQTIKNIMPCKSKGTSCRSHFLEDGCVKADTPVQKSNLLSNFFSNVAMSLRKKSIFMKDFIWRQPNKVEPIRTQRFDFKYVSKSFVEKELKNLKRHKATGIDNLPPAVMKDSANEISQPLCFIINLSLSTADVPTEWKHPTVTPIHKSGPSTKVDNYRPISILPIASRILERAVHTQLMKYLEKNNLLSEQQFGYRRKRSTDIAATVFLDSIRTEIDRGNLVGATFIDLSKAFDTVGHSILLSKLPSFGIHDNELKWFTDYLFNRKQQVVYENSKSNVSNMTCGVPQGSILGPLLFLIYFNDFKSALRKSKTVKFADDTVLYVAHKSVQDIENALNDELKNISTYLANNDLVINLKKGKTEVMLFGSGKKLSSIPHKPNIKFGTVDINVTKRYKYLGSTIDPTLTLSDNFNKAYKKASSRLRLLQNLRKNMDNNTATTIYNTMIIPLVVFNSIINLNFSKTEINKLNSLDSRAKQITKNANIKSTYTVILRHACKTVKKCFAGETCSNMKEYFEVNSHSKCTRNQNCLLKISKIKLEVTRGSFRYMGAKIYNSLPLDIRKATTVNDFNQKIKDFGMEDASTPALFALGPQPLVVADTSAPTLFFMVTYFTSPTVFTGGPPCFMVTPCTLVYFSLFVTSWMLWHPFSASCCDQCTPSTTLSD